MIPAERAWRSPIAWAAAGLLLVLGALLVGRLNLPNDRYMTICFFRLTTGVPCPGCGLTRGISALSRGEFAQALKYHPAAPLLAFEAALIWIFWGAVAFRVVSPPSIRGVNLFLIAQVSILLVVWWVRLATGTWRLVA